jgi:hypothetical protein
VIIWGGLPSSVNQNIRVFLRPPQRSFRAINSQRQIILIADSDLAGPDVPMHPVCKINRHPRIIINRAPGNVGCQRRA